MCLDGQFFKIKSQIMVIYCILLVVYQYHCSCLAIMGRLPLKRLLGYWIAQYLGAFVSSAVVFGIYHGNLC